MNKEQKREYDRKYNQTIMGKLNNNKNTKKWQKNNREKQKAQDKLRGLFRYGNINNTDFICVICGKQPIQKHHENYDLPFLFIPLCMKHHVDTQEGIYLE